MVNFESSGIKFIIFNGIDFIDWHNNSGFNNVYYFDIVGNVGLNQWKNKTNIQLVIKDIAISESATVKIERPEDMVF